MTPPNQFMMGRYGLLQSKLKIIKPTKHLISNRFNLKDIFWVAARTSWLAFEPRKSSKDQGSRFCPLFCLPERH